MSIPHLLVIEDDPDIVQLLKLDLEDAGYRVSHASSVMAGLTHVREDTPDLVLLDLGLPDGRGRDVLTRIRHHSPLPVIILTAQGDLDSKVQLLNLGADDYLMKPFELDELLARVAVQLRRSFHTVTALGALELSTTQRWVRYAGYEVPLSPKEFEILQALMDEPGRVFTQAELFASVWGEEFQSNSNLLNVHMANLRNKLRDVGGFGLIRTVRGFGYAVQPDGRRGD